MKRRVNKTAAGYSKFWLIPKNKQLYSIFVLLLRTSFHPALFMVTHRKYISPLILYLLGCFLYWPLSLSAQDKTCIPNTNQDWWQVLHYQLSIDFTDTFGEQLKGENKLSFKVLKSGAKYLQLDLDTPLMIQAVRCQGRSLTFERKGNYYLVTCPKWFWQRYGLGDSLSLHIQFAGRPWEAKNAPWEGGIIRKRDRHGKIWWAMTCQEEGAALWFPCKNIQSEEPIAGILLNYTVPAGLVAIGNGRLIRHKREALKHQETYTWQVVNPINNYNITFYIGDYQVAHSTYFSGLKGPLDLSYYALSEHADTAFAYFNQKVPLMLACFERSFGPYPFYEDGYQLVEAPYLGMEHQSAVAYGNKFRLGYLGRDRSGTGEGLDFDFIIIHESAHEWFGNSLTSPKKSANWIHEGFASYAETLYLECEKGPAAAFTYQEGKRSLVLNDRPIIDTLKPCEGASGDAYDKAGFVIHQIRRMMQNDSLFFRLLEKMNRRFYHQIVHSKEIEHFLEQESHLDLKAYFEQYLYRNNLPVLSLRENEEGSFVMRWEGVIPGFNMPIPYQGVNGEVWLSPDTEGYKPCPKDFSIESLSKDFLYELKLP